MVVNLCETDSVQDTKTGTIIPYRLRFLFAVKIVKHKFLSALYLLHTSAPDVLDHMWPGSRWAGDMLECILIPDWN